MVLYSRGTERTSLSSSLLLLSPGKRCKSFPDYQRGPLPKTNARFNWPKKRSPLRFEREFRKTRLCKRLTSWIPPHSALRIGCTAIEKPRHANFVNTAISLINLGEKKKRRRKGREGGSLRARFPRAIRFYGLPLKTTDFKFPRTTFNIGTEIEIYPIYSCSEFEFTILLHNLTSAVNFA